jgi:hypothetical protein
MKPTLTKEAYRELTEILQRKFKGKYPEELIEDFGLTLLNLTAIAIKRRLRINKQKDILKSSIKV